MKPITESRYRAAVEEAAQWIDQSFTAPLALADAAKVAWMSPYHFQRVFAAMLGETPGDYVRRRRLERSLQLLAATNYSVQAVASMAGFESGSVLCHVMARTLGMSPTVFRRQDRASSLSAVRAQAISDAPIRLPLEDKPIALIYLPEHYALMRMACGLRRRSFTTAAGPQAVEALAADYQTLWPGTPLGMRFVMCPDETLASDDPSERLVAGIIAPDGRAPAIDNKDLLFDRLPGGWYAVFEQHGDLRHTWQMWNRVRRYSLAANGLMQRKVPRFEVLQDDPQQVRPHALRAHLYVPVYPAGAGSTERARWDEQDQGYLSFLRGREGDLFTRLFAIQRQAA